jgi:hypothetical protein
MTVRTRWLIAMVIAPVVWGVACHDDDGPTARAIPSAGVGSTPVHG